MPNKKTQRSGLQNAAFSGSSEVCRAILRKGADPNTTDKYKLTAAHDASKGGHFNVLRVPFKIHEYIFLNFKLRS